MIIVFRLSIGLKSDNFSFDLMKLKFGGKELFLSDKFEFLLKTIDKQAL